MANKKFQFVSLIKDLRYSGDTLASVWPGFQPKKERILFVTPHDDDTAIGGALLMLAAVAEKVPVDVALVTNGVMGYCHLKDRERIIATRAAETYDSFKLLGLKRANVHWLGYPDCGLNQYAGRRPAKPGEPGESHGYNGLQHSFTELLRRIRPTHVVLPTSADLHPDHRVVHSEFLMSCFHAPGPIWPELGKPLPQPPVIHEMAVYCNFPAPPNLRIIAPAAAFQKKLDAMLAFRSQQQFELLAKTVRETGPIEFIRTLSFDWYNPAAYTAMFDARG